MTDILKDQLKLFGGKKAPPAEADPAPEAAPEAAPKPVPEAPSGPPP